MDNDCRLSVRFQVHVYRFRFDREIRPVITHKSEIRVSHRLLYYIPSGPLGYTAIARVHADGLSMHFRLRTNCAATFPENLIISVNAKYNLCFSKPDVTISRDIKQHRIYIYCGQLACTDLFFMSFINFEDSHF